MLLRLIVLGALALCLFSLAKVGLRKWSQRGQTTAPATSQVVDTSSIYPTAQLTGLADVVRSPYRDDVLLDIHPFQPGRLVLCSATRKPFFVPSSHQPGLEFGQLAGTWELRIHEPRVHVYELQLSYDLAVVRGQGRRVRVDDEVVKTDATFSTVTFEGIMQGNRLTGFLKETFPRTTQRTVYDCDLTFDSHAGRLTGNGRRNDQSIYMLAEKQPPKGQRIPSLAKSEDGFVPPEWQRIDSFAGQLPNREGQFLALVMEENTKQRWRWLLLAHKRAGENYSAEVTTHLAILPGAANRAGDAFRGLFASPAGLPGEFLIRHDTGGGQGSEFHFRYEIKDKTWHLVAGKTFSFQPQAGGKSVVQHYKTGVLLKQFSISQLPEEVPPSAKPATAP